MVNNRDIRQRSQVGGGQGWSMLSFRSEWRHQMEMPNLREWGKPKALPLKSGLEIGVQSHRDRGEQNARPGDLVDGYPFFLPGQHPFGHKTALGFSLGSP